MSKKHERVFFRLFVCPSCGHHLCWVNPRKPTYCPECADVSIQDPTAVRFSDDEAELIINEA